MSKKRILIVLPEKGDLYMEIKASDGMSLYCGNGKENTEFTVSIRESEQRYSRSGGLRGI